MLEPAQDRIEWHLSNWARWHRSGGVALWYPSRSSGNMGRSGSSDFDSMCANADCSYAVAVDTIIDDLERKERYTVYNEWLATVFRFDGDPVELYESARRKIERGLSVRGMW